MVTKQVSVRNKTKKILVIEDDPVSIAIVVQVVEKVGFMAIRASDGLKGLHVLMDNPDIVAVITDIKMPNMDGRQFIQIVRGKEPLRAIPIIIISAIASEENLRDILTLGASWYIPKPVKVKALRETLAMLF